MIAREGAERCFEMSERVGSPMHNEHSNNPNANDDQTIAEREQYLIELISKRLQENQLTDAESLAQVVPLLPEPLKQMAMHTIAEQWVLLMKMHALHLAATFYQKAESENITKEDRDATIQDTEADIFALMRLIHRLTIHTPEALARLGTITTSLRNLSQYDTADSIQSCLYQLPEMYQTSLEREHLVGKDIAIVIAPPTSTPTNGEQLA